MTGRGRWRVLREPRRLRLFVLLVSRLQRPANNMKPLYASPPITASRELHLVSGTNFTLNIAWKSYLSD